MSAQKDRPLRSVGKRLTSDQHVAAVLLAHGFNQTQVAQYLGITKQVVSTWNQYPDYVAEVENAKAQMLQQLGGKLGTLRESVMQGAEEAVEVLREGLKASTERGEPRWAVRQKSADALLGNAVRLIGAEARMMSALSAGVGDTGSDGEGTSGGTEGDHVVLVDASVVQQLMGRMADGRPAVVPEGTPSGDEKVEMIPPRSLIPQEYGGERTD
jgi:predicted transcriptional regulator